MIKPIDFNSVEFVKFDYYVSFILELFLCELIDK